jgi:hypothetical protein
MSTFPIVPLPTIQSRPECEPMGTCDWGGCDQEVIAWRWSHEVREWLPVCRAHSRHLELV